MASVPAGKVAGVTDKEDDAARAFIGLRGGKSTVVRFVDGAVPGGVKKTGAYRVLIDAHDLTMTDGRLKGTVVVRQVSIWAPMALLAQVTLKVDAQASAGRRQVRHHAVDDGDIKVGV